MNVPTDIVERMYKAMGGAHGYILRASDNGWDIKRIEKDLHDAFRAYEKWKGDLKMKNENELTDEQIKDAILCDGKIACCVCRNNHAGKTGNTSYCVSMLACALLAERDEREKNPGVFDKARPDEAYAEISFFVDKSSISSKGWHIENYTRELPKTIEQEIIDEILPPDDDKNIMTTSSARHKMAKALARYAEAIKKE